MCHVLKFYVMNDSAKFSWSHKTTSEDTMMVSHRIKFERSKNEHRSSTLTGREFHKSNASNSNSPSDSSTSATGSSSCDGQAILPPWITTPRVTRKRKSPLEFELEASGRKITVVYDSMLNKSMASLPFLKTFKLAQIDRVPPKFVRIPSNQNRFEICYERAKIPIRIDDKLRLDYSLFCTTTFPEKKLFFGREFGQKYIRQIDVHTNLMTLSDGKTEVRVKFCRLKYKKKSTMK